jgi:hypothetical protein
MLSEIAAIRPSHRFRAMGTTIKQAAALAEARVEAQRLAEGR